MRRRERRGDSVSRRGATEMKDQAKKKPERAARGGGATARRGDRGIVPGKRSAVHDADLRREAATVTLEARGGVEQVGAARLIDG